MSTVVGYFWGKRKRTVSCAWREQFKRGPVPSARAVSLSAVRNALTYSTTTSRKRSKLMGQWSFFWPQFRKVIRYIKSVTGTSAVTCINWYLFVFIKGKRSWRIHFILTVLNVIFYYYYMYVFSILFLWYTILHLSHFGNWYFLQQLIMHAHKLLDSWSFVKFCCRLSIVSSVTT